MSELINHMLYYPVEIMYDSLIDWFTLSLVHHMVPEMTTFQEKCLVQGCLLDYPLGFK